MRTLTNAYLNAAKAVGRYPNIRVVIDQLELTGSAEVISIQLTRGETSKPSAFEYAAAIGSSGTITVDRRTIDPTDEADITAGAPIEISAFFCTASGAELGSAKLFTGLITAYNKQDKVKGIISVSDYMLLTGIDFNPESLTYPCDISDVLDAAFLQAGFIGYTAGDLTLDIDPVINEPPYKAEEPVAEGMNGSPYTCREIITAIAGMNLAPIFVDADGAPKSYGYGSAIATTVGAAYLTALTRTEEEYGLDRVKVFKTSEKMAKTAGNYRNLAYGPRLPEMEELDSGTLWYQQITDKVTNVSLLHWDWRTATATIQGVGEIELGDRVTFTADSETVKMFVTGIVYRFENAHFTETLYSFAQTEEEYKMSGSRSTAVTTKSEKDKSKKDYFKNTDPATNNSGIKAGDRWYVLDNMTDKNITQIKEYKLVSAATSTTDAVYTWELKGNIPAGGSGGVGENIGQHNERHNDYDTTSGNGIYGTSNADYCSFRNYHNKINNGGGYAADMSGYRNTVTGGGYAYDVGGNTNTASGTLNGAFLRGHNNSVANAQYGGTFGEDNTVSGAYASLTAGQDNTVSGDNTLTVGENNTNTNSGAIAGGRFANTGADKLLAIGSSYAQGNILTCDQYGNVTAAAYNTNNADYGEYFEWCDGNPDNNDRMGLLVDQIGDKIAPAQGTEFFGAISARASVVGNAYESYWHGKYLTDVYGRMLMDENGAAIINPEYDPGREYVPRSQRPEWDIAGIVGCIIIRDDGSCKVGAYVSARNGVGTSCYARTPAKVLRRIDENHVEVLIK